MRYLPFLSASVCLLAAPTAWGVISLGGSTSDWTAIGYPAGSQSDYLDDQQTGHVASDLVGDATGNQSAFYKQYQDAGVIGDITDDYLGFRIRLAAPDGQDGSPSWDSRLLLGIDVGADGAADIFIIVTQKSGGSISYYSVDSVAEGANTSPSTTAVSLLNPGTSPFVWTRTPSSPYFDYSAVSTTTDAYLNSGGDGATNNLDGLNRNNKDDTDFFLSFQVDMLTLIEAVSLSTGAVLDENSNLGFLVGTSIQDNAFNQDLNGQNGDSADGDAYTQANQDKTWAQLGAASDVYTASGTEAVPEPATYALIFGCVTLGFVACRRRR